MDKFMNQWKFMLYLENKYLFDVIYNNVCMYLIK